MAETNYALLASRAWYAAEMAKAAWLRYKNLRMKQWSVSYDKYWVNGDGALSIEQVDARIESDIKSNTAIQDAYKEAREAQSIANSAAKAARESAGVE